MRFGFLAFFALRLDVRRLLLLRRRDVDLLRLAFLLADRDLLLDFFVLLLGARGFEAVRRRDLLLERDFFAPRGVAARRARDLDRDLERLVLLRFLELDLRRLTDLERLVEAIEADLERLAARGLLAVRFRDLLRDFERDRLADREVLADRLGALGAAALRLAFLRAVRRRAFERDLDFFGALGLLAVLLRDLLLDLDFLAPLGVAARRARDFDRDWLRLRLFLELDLRRLADLERETLVDADLDRLAARGLLAVRRRDLLRDLERLADFEVLADRLGALGTAARRRLAFRARRRLALLLERERDWDFFGARGFEAVRRFALRERLRDLEAAFAFFADRPADSERSRLPVSFMRAAF